MTDHPRHIDLPAALPSGLAAPFVHGGEGARTIFVVTIAAACGPLLAGIVLFGWRAAIVAGIAIFSCAAIERLYYRVTKVPALLGRTHAYLTGLLLALTLPPFVPWYVPVVAAAFAIIVGKAVFGGVGHFLWQPALVGRLAVAAIFSGVMNPGYWPVLGQDHLLVGDITNCRQVEVFHDWRNTPSPRGYDGFALRTPRWTLAPLTDGNEPAYSAIAYAPIYISESTTNAAGPIKPPALMRLPAVNNLLYGAYGGGIGETCAIVIIVAGIYLVYRNYIKWRIPLMFIAAAAVMVALAPIQLQGPNHTVVSGWGPPGGWFSPQLPAHEQWLSLSAWGDWAGSWNAPPLFVEGSDVGFFYLCYQLLGGELLLAAFFLATEMTSRPVTGGGQAIFGIGCGVLAMVLRLYTSLPIPCYLAVLAMNTITPTIDALWRPRVLGTRRPWWRLGIR